MTKLMEIIGFCKGTNEFRKGTTGPSHSYTGQGMAHGLGPRSNHYFLVRPNVVVFFNQSNS